MRSSSEKANFTFRPTTQPGRPGIQSVRNRRQRVSEKSKYGQENEPIVQTGYHGHKTSPNTGSPLDRFDMTGNRR